MDKRNRWRGKLERYAIPNLTLYLIICYGIGYLLEFTMPAIYQYLMLDPFLIMKGQIWRLVTWVLIPPDSSNLFFVLITLYLYYSLGNLLERIWGTYRYNVYIFSGILFTILGAFVLWGYCMIKGAVPVGYAGIVYGVILLVNCIQGGIATWIVVGFSLLNFLVYFISTKGKMQMSPKQMKRQREFRQKMRAADNASRGVTKHKCAICGRTELDGDDLEFRFCSKCNGNYEYCQYHLFTHEHVK